MATPTYDLLASTTLATAASSVTFSSIDQSYGDLTLSIAGKTTSLTDVMFRFNSDSGSNYNVVNMYANVDGAVSSSFGTTSGWLAPITWGPDDIQTLKIDIFDYTAAKHKTVLSRGSNGSKFVDASANRWANTAAITSLEIRVNTNFAAGATLNLYGVAK